MPFPTHRLRRLRTTGRLRDLVRETRLDPAQFILPLFACPGEGVRREIGAMPGNYQLSIDAFGSNGNSGSGSIIYINPYLQVGAGGSTFSISTSPPQTTAPGGTAQYTVSESGSAGLGNVLLTATAVSAMVRMRSIQPRWSSRLALGT